MDHPVRCRYEERSQTEELRGCAWLRARYEAERQAWGRDGNAQPFRAELHLSGSSFAGVVNERELELSNERRSSVSNGKVSRGGAPLKKTSTYSVLTALPAPRFRPDGTLITPRASAAVDARVELSYVSWDEQYAIIPWLT